MKLLADRFVLMDSQRVIDLSTGGDVVLITSSAGGPADQRRWTVRCDSFSRLHHRVFAPLVDYGLFGEMQRFEAWRCDGTWRGTPREAGDVVRTAELFLRGSGLTGGISRHAVVEYCRRPVIVPENACGYASAAASVAAVDAVDDVPLEACGVGLIDRQAVAAVAELFTHPSSARSCAVALWGPRGAGLTTAIRELARIARVHGFVPLSIGNTDARIIELLRGRSLFIIDRTGAGGGWGELLHAVLRSPKPHVLLLAGSEEIRTAPGLALEPLTARALVDALRPREPGLPAARRVEEAAKRSNGLPGRFAELLWGSSRMTPPRPARLARLEYSPVKAAEQPARYGEGAVEGSNIMMPAEARPWPATDLSSLKRRMEAAIGDLDRNRHAPGARALRQAICALARRADWASAARGGVALASSLVKRGQPREAQIVLAEAREHAGRLAHSEPLADIAILSGIASTDLGRLDEAENIIQAAVAGLRAAGDHPRSASAAVALARCLFWRGRHDDAHRVLSSIADLAMSPASSTQVAMASARVAVGRRDLSAAVSSATAALEAAGRLNDPAILAGAACSAAFAHLSVGDSAAVERDVATGVRAARLARDPLRALKARLIGAESARRAGRGGVATALLARVRKLPLPAIIAARCALLRDLISTTSPSDAVSRHVAATGLGALALFAPSGASGEGSRLQSTVDDLVEILRCCQLADEEETVLAQVCAGLRSRLQAAGVAVFGRAGGTLSVLASSGSRVEPAIAERVTAAAQVIAPHAIAGRLEGGAPIRYAGQTLGALVGRWTLGTSADLARAAMVLTMAATAAGPAAALALARRAQRPDGSTDDLLGVSGAILDVRRAVDRAAGAPFAVLIEGESGSGKELVARAVHRRSSRRDRPFCALNCAALPDDLVEAELFGHARGAFTGAVLERPGVFEEAHTGTLLLDEIGELSLRAQAKVLRTIQEGELRRVGENTARRVDVRLVSATNRDLRNEVAAGRFRLDLLYRIDVLRITVPPLRERREDIGILVERFWQAAAARVGSRAVLGTATIAALARYDWPGNVRELQNVLAALAVRSPKHGVVPPVALPPVFGEAAAAPAWRLEQARRTFEDRFVRAALVRCGGHRGRAAEELGLSRQGLTKLMARLGITESLQR